MTNKIIAIDVDGVLVNYNKAYAEAWERAFGERLGVVDPNAYWATEYWNARHLEAKELAHFKSVGMDEEFWSTMDPMPGTTAFLAYAYAKDYTVIPVSKADERVQPWRAANLETLYPGLFPITICTGETPKYIFCNAMNAEYFIDDYAPYFYNVKAKKILVNRDPGPNSPNFSVKAGDFYRIVNNLGEIRCL